MLMLSTRQTFRLSCTEHAECVVSASLAEPDCGQVHARQTLACLPHLPPCSCIPAESAALVPECGCSFDRLADVLAQCEETEFRPAYAYRLVASVLEALSAAKPGR